MVDVLDDREVYPNAPLKLVACELRLQFAPGSDVDAIANEFYEDVEQDYPLTGPAEQGVRIDFTPGGPVPTSIAGGFRYLSRDRTRSVTVTPSSLVLETSTYSHFENFCEAIGAAVEALGERLKVTSVERVGLRYIDELVINELPDGSTDGYFVPSLLASGTAIDGLGEPTEHFSISSYALGDDQHAVMRAGRMNQPIVAADGPLRIPRPSTAPLFVIDVDCAWAAVKTAPLTFERPVISKMLSELHRPIRILFEHAITDKLRNDVLRREITES